MEINIGGGTMYYVLLSSPERGLLVLGGGWTPSAAQQDAEHNCADTSDATLYSVPEHLGDKIELEGDNYDLAYAVLEAQH